MGKFKKGQIVYVSDDGVVWVLSHFTEMFGVLFKASPILFKALNGDGHHYCRCLSVDDYRKMINQPKHKDLVWAWNMSRLKRICGFYDGEEYCLFDGVKYDNYEVIPRDQWPQWAIEAYELLED